MVIKSLKVVHTDPAILHVEIEPITSNYFRNAILDRNNYETQTQRGGYGDLGISSSRMPMIHETGIYKKINSAGFKKEFGFEISWTFLQLDTIRYPMTTRYKEDYKTYYEQMLLHELKLEATIDLPGYRLDSHLDNRYVMWSSSINLMDNQTSTVFHTIPAQVGNGYLNSEPIYEGSRKCWEGTCWLNTEVTWHAVPPIPEGADRHILLLNQFLISPATSKRR